MLRICQSYDFILSFLRSFPLSQVGPREEKKNSYLVNKALKLKNFQRKFYIVNRNLIVESENRVGVK